MIGPYVQEAGSTNRSGCTAFAYVWRSICFSACALSRSGYYWRSGVLASYLPYTYLNFPIQKATLAQPNRSRGHLMSAPNVGQYSRAKFSVDQMKLLQRVIWLIIMQWVKEINDRCHRLRRLLEGRNYGKEPIFGEMSSRIAHMEHGTLSNSLHKTS
jgi:hypothetical protein